MSCHGCSESFGFLNRERGCPQCGFAYCKKCLRFKIQVEGKSVQVCKRCYNIENSADPENRRKMDRSLSFTEAAHVIKAINRLDSLENPAKPPIVLYSKDAKPDISNLRVGMTPEDQALVDRLANLRNSQKNRRASEDPAEDIAQRLAHLRGDDPEAASSLQKMNPLLVSRKPETDHELMDRLGREANMDQRYKDNLTSDIEERLQRLRSGGTTSNAPGGSQLSEAMEEESNPGEELTEAEEVQRIIDRFTAEVEIEKSSGQVTEDEPSADVDLRSEDETDDDNFCRICDERATLGCKECEGEVYCPKCFQEFHREIGEAHKPFKLK